MNKFLSSYMEDARALKRNLPNRDFEMIDGNFMTESAGWSNKMFVRANLMKHHIRITDVKTEHLRDISEEDALREGIFKLISGFYCFPNEEYAVFSTPRRAFAELIDKVSGKGTWGNNPWVAAYSFELVD